MDNINLTQRQLDLIKKNQAILSKLPIETYAKVVNTMNDLRINQSKLSDWASYMHRVTKNHPMFKTNLFSEKILDEFISSNSFPEDEVRKVSTHLRNSFVDTVDVPVLGKTVDSAHPIDDVNTEKYNSVFNESLNHIFISPSAKFIKKVSVGSAIGVTSPVMVRTILDQYVNYFMFFNVIATLLTLYVIANYLYDENSNDD
ncbi:TPA: hypothetical protein QHD64_002767 [Staphylococcus aureus]|uniref:hypothetical protein n=2 Tax=Staphylococcus TaxID=1279 RepID=UPI0001BAF881|nr:MULTISPECIES: hypothetical protein [Staphylococcus]ACY10743.1 conserved hypothetical phage protein [Staphylococcus aureus subsp. aureus ED98]AXG26550.1 hypothetical protein BJL64_04215 [Staphylococcus aureus]AXG29307.1 hypothetical protein BJL65_04210 [Staphylococcus aureus]EZT80734.1 hypothetical protein V103_00552 [Staphylococcus aureus 22(2K81-5)]EZT85083.1 hypothetical protein V082_00645 [Staphylococcus aureus 2011-60-2275-7]